MCIQARRKDLERDHTVEQSVIRLVDDAHAAGTDFLLDDVVIETCTRNECCLHRHEIACGQRQ